MLNEVDDLRIVILVNRCRCGASLLAVPFSGSILMRLQSIFLSSAALLASATVGFAADLPTKKAAPVEYVRVCSQFGAGYFYIPGSDTCLKLSGRVRADANYNEPFTRQANTTSTRARGYIG